MAVMDRYEGSGQLVLEIGMHEDNYVYVECKDDKVARMRNRMIWTSLY
jgi:hypothetical protein